MAKPIAQTAPPRNIEPVSPIKTFAGCRFQTRKPRQAPARAMATAALIAGIAANLIYNLI